MMNIERSLLVSVLEHNFIQNDKKILEVILNPDYFNHPHHKIFVKAINRLKELDEPIDSDTMRHKFLHAEKWDKNIVADITMEDSLLNIMTHNPFTTFYLFNKYYNLLKNEYENNKKMEILKYEC